MESKILKNIFKEVIEKEYDNLIVESDIVTRFITYLKKYCLENNIELAVEKEYSYKNRQRCDLHISTTENNVKDEHFIEFKYYWQGSANDFLKQVLYDKDKLLTLGDKGKLCFFCFYHKKFKNTAEKLYAQLKSNKIIPEFIPSY